MTKFIPIFPLNIVVFPNEDLNLHIFEERYKQLIKECIADKKEFLIPCSIDQQIKEVCAAVEVFKIEKQYDGGELDIRCKGIKTYRILEVIKEVPNKLYQGAIVSETADYVEDGVASKMKIILRELETFHTLLQLKKDYSLPAEKLKVNDIAHHIGLSVEEEYELLCLQRESQRQEYILRHLRKILPTVHELNNLKDRIQLNGHFRKLSAD